ncbi:MAG: hypothetical protein HY553_00440 [Elusimicrobia bacterium]|nr:hypothetical protein [Elusimicrobiota bacterium]
MFLATTELKEFWDTSDELALLGPWCVRFDDPDWLKGLRHRRTPNAWDDRAALERASRYCEESQPGLLEALAAALNEAHGTDLSVRYWRILLGPWLLFLCHQAYDRLEQLKAALAAFPGARTYALDRRDYYVPRGDRDSNRASLTPAYELQMYSDALRVLGREAPAKRLSRADAPGDPSPLGPQGLRGRLKRAMAFGTAVLIRRRTPDVVTDELYPAARLVWRYARKTGWRAFPLLTQPELQGPTPDLERRRALEGLFDKDEFHRLLSLIVPWALPTLYLEGFREAREGCVARRSKTPKAVFSSTSVYFEDSFKFSLAEWAERGARVWGMQHGGVYGIGRLPGGETHERAISDRYFTWGWSKTENDPKLADLPAPHLSTIAPGLRARPGGPGILYVTAEFLRSPLTLTPGPLGWQWERIFEAREAFLDALGGLRSRARVRLPVHRFGWRSGDRLKARFPDVAIDDHSRNYYQRLEECRLVAIDHPSTTMLESLSLDVPTVLFWDPDLWELRPTAEPVFAGLRAAGILQPDAAAAAAQVARVYADPDAWWRTEPVQAARRAFAGTFARLSEDWAQDWAAATSRELSVGL